MKQILKTYNLELKVQGPVFVGNGEEIQKKEYVFLNGRHALGVVDIEKLYQLARKKGLASDMEQFMVRDTRTTLRQWSDSHRIKPDELKACMKYIVDAGDMQQEKGRMQIMACIKDPYGKPYIPGSSIKGMLRTILLGAEMIQHPEKYEHLAENIQDDLYNGNERNRKKVLSRNISAIEKQTFRTLNRLKSKPQDAVNDWMAGVIVSDSEPLSMKDVAVCQKWEQHVNGTEKTLNLMRECIRPGTVIRCQLTIDETISPLTGEKLLEAVKVFYQRYEKAFQQHFPYQSVASISDATVFLGGGSGFVSKTIIYDLFQQKEAVRVTKDIFRRTNVPREHKHDKDIGLGVSPHVLKCTKLNGKKYMMGQCEMRLKEMQK